jgi:ATP-dependent Clp protease ATP-binding subunit ClpC
MAERFDKFTVRARNVLKLAQEEAVHLNNNYIGTEHLLLGVSARAKASRRACSRRWA